MNEIKIFSNFDSGNGEHLETKSIGDNNYEIHIKTRCDCFGTKFARTNARSWYYFGVSGANIGDRVKFIIHGTSALKKLYSQGHTPVYKSKGGKWLKLKNCSYYFEKSETSKKKKFVVSFIYKFVKKADYYFAFCYPFSYGDLQKKLNNLSKKYENHPDIYFNNSVIVKTLENKDLNVLTISSFDKITSQKEEIISNLYPNSSPPNKFRNKPIFLITSRIHSGETPASYIMNGFIDFILHETDPRAKELREKFVFKCVPMLNPDGCFKGHWRFHSMGFELNGCYHDPEIDEEPTIFAVKRLIEYLWVDRDLKFYVDLHSHVNMKCSFIFGNALKDYDEQVSNILYPKLVSLNTQHLDFKRCNFSTKRMENFTGTSRVVLFTQLGFVHAYTLEVNFHSGDKVNLIGKFSPQSKDFDKQIRYEKGGIIKYKVSHFRDIGKALAVGLLDFETKGKGKFCRLKNTKYKNYIGVKRWIENEMKINPKLWRHKKDLIVNYKFENGLRNLMKIYKLKKHVLCRLFEKYRGNLVLIEKEINSM